MFRLRRKRALANAPTGRFPEVWLRSRNLSVAASESSLLDPEALADDCPGIPPADLATAPQVLKRSVFL